MSKFLKLGDAIFRADEVVSVRVLAHPVTQIDVNGHPVRARTEAQLVIKLGQRHEVELAATGAQTSAEKRHCAEAGTHGERERINLSASLAS